MHAARYLGVLTRCKGRIFETCIKPDARQLRFGLSALCNHSERLSGFDFKNRSSIIVSDSPKRPALIQLKRLGPIENLRRDSHELRQSSLRLRDNAARPA